MAVMWWMPLSFIARATISRTEAACLCAPVELVADELVRALGPVAQDRPGVARVDDLLDTEALRRPERRGHGLQPRGYLLAQRGRVLGRLELAPVRGLEPAGHREGAPVARRPREPQVRARAVAVAGPRHAVHLADEDRHP